MKSFFFAAFLLFSGVSAFARIGDCEAACQARYGDPQRIWNYSHGIKIVTFDVRSTFHLQITFLNDRACEVKYQKYPANGPTTFSEEELDQILALNSNSPGKWYKASDDLWRNPETGNWAYFPIDHSFVAIETDDDADVQKMIQEEDAQKTTSGL